MGDKLLEFDFFYTGIYGYLNFPLKNAINNKFVYYFKDKGELLNLFEKICVGPAQF